MTVAAHSEEQFTVLSFQLAAASPLFLLKTENRKLLERSSLLLEL
jgi:hypothetical protein